MWRKVKGEMRTFRMQVQSIESEEGKKGKKKREKIIGQERGEYRISGREVKRITQRSISPSCGVGCTGCCLAPGRAVGMVTPPQADFKQNISFSKLLSPVSERGDFFLFLLLAGDMISCQ